MGLITGRPTIWRPVLSSVYSDSYQRLLELLVAARKEGKLTQEQLAEKLGKPQSFISKYERGERRLDVIEFIEVCKILRVDPSEMIKQIGN